MQPQLPDGAAAREDGCDYDPTSDEETPILDTDMEEEADMEVEPLAPAEGQCQPTWVPSRRFHSKKPLVPGGPDAKIQVRMLCSNRGECSGCGRHQHKDQEEKKLVEAWMVMEHAAMRKMIQEERQLLGEGEGEESLRVVQDGERQCKELEMMLQDVNTDKDIRQDSEVTVNQPVSWKR